MTDHDALLRAICEHPEEDTPRLIFADWLDEHADALPTPGGVRSRATFIRDDIAMSQREEFDPLRLRWELIEKPQRETEGWVKEALPALPDGCELSSKPLFRRGFVSGVSLESKNRRALPEPPSGSFPLTHIRFFACALLGIDLLQRACWRKRLSAIEFVRGGRASLTDFHRFFALDDLGSLEHLSLLQHSIDRRELDRLTASPVFGRLSALSITSTPLGVPFVESFSRLGSPIPLRELHLVGCRMTPGAVTTLLASPAAGSLQALSLGCDRIAAPEKFRALGRAGNPPAIRSLDMSDDSPNDEGLEEFLASPLVPRLQRLVLAGCAINRQRTRLLASGKFDSLRILDMSSNPVGNDGAAAIARSPHFAGLLVLHLSYSQVGDEGVEAILESPLADSLVLLDLRGSPASEEVKEVLNARMGDRVRL